MVHKLISRPVISYFKPKREPVCIFSFFVFNRTIFIFIQHTVMYCTSQILWSGQTLLFYHRVVRAVSIISKTISHDTYQPVTMNAHLIHNTVILHWIARAFHDTFTAHEHKPTTILYTIIFISKASYILYIRTIMYLYVYRFLFIYPTFIWGNIKQIIITKGTMYTLGALKIIGKELLFFFCKRLLFSSFILICLPSATNAKSTNIIPMSYCNIYIPIGRYTQIA